MELEERKFYQIVVIMIAVTFVLIVLGSMAIYNWKSVRMAELGYNETTTFGSPSLVYQKAK